MDPLDHLAEILHDGWCEYMRQEGFTFGARDYPNKTHDHLISWDKKPEKDKNQDRYQAATILRKWYREELSKEEIPKLIHDSWRDWMKITGQSGKKNYDRPFYVIHETDLMDHKVQAPLVFDFLKHLPYP